ncbi:hypothetical protein DOTSEDRAFT_67720 [Dothistroma septosporum NZE10]|uniref:HMG box domain-containing protein n=1 Tax=Dothistroma septosporum (strain NZE10 / CBS 128990) TaxID=675120 RepID=N1Q2A7_DOTSN|nr:hypothetical protein DOTSEDRAFT_67720 [Dothistroma septosporum NZE10]
MSTAHQPSLPSLPSGWTSPYTGIQTQPANEPARIVFTRQLWQRTMPDGSRSDQSVLNKSHSQECPDGSFHAASSSRRTSSASSWRRSPSPSRSKTPLTPEESPPFRTTTKRTAGIVEEEDKDVDCIEPTSTHTRHSSGDSGAHVCICQPDPKIPRPRNAFILYRQHHQANVISQHPGLANPEISKIIGEQWQNQPPEVKNKWKALAEEEKIRHQQQYPTYRYRPKRSGRRNSLSSDGLANAEKLRCTKCGGRSILAPSTPYSLQSSGLSPASSQHTPASASTPVTKTLSVLRDLSVQSPAARRVAKQSPGSNMSLNHGGHTDERDELGPFSPDAKRRRFNGDHLSSIARPMPPRYVVAPHPGSAVGPGTPFPFGQLPPHPYPPGAAHARRESLPGIRGVVSPPGTMAPPPRPGPGYQQHRLSQGHIAHDRSLTLPPLQTGSSDGAAVALATQGVTKSAKDQIMTMDFSRKVAILRRVAPPGAINKSAPRGPFVAIEGDTPEAAKELGVWLNDTLRRDDDLSISLLEGPKLSAGGRKESLMSQYHCLVADWLIKSGEIRESLWNRARSPTDSVMVDAVPPPAARSRSREIDEVYDDTASTSPKERVVAGADGERNSPLGRKSSDLSAMDVSRPVKAAANDPSKGAATGMPISIVANYSLHASNFFACHVPIGSNDPYSPVDHWQWTASQWRGIVGPDLTIYVRDAVTGDIVKQSVDMNEEGNLFVVKRTKVDGKESMEIEAATLRRLGFEVSEWVRAFGSNATE